MLSNQEITLQQEILAGLFNDNSLIPTTREIIKPDMFTVQAYKEMYKLIIEMKSKGLEVDTLTFSEYYKDKITELGGTRYITEIAACLPSLSGHETRLKLLVDNFKRNKIKEITSKIQDEQNVEKLISILENTLKSVYESEVVENIDISKEYEKYLNWIYEEDQQIGFKSGLSALDEALGNFQKGRLITLFARSGLGKSTVAIQIALNMAKQGIKVIYGSGEMGQHEVLGKMCSSDLSIPYNNIINKKLSDNDKQRILILATMLLDKKFHVSNETNISKLINEIKVYKLQYGLDVIFIDYINNYLNGVNGYNNTSERIGAVTSELKKLAIKENICVILLAQCNRNADKNTGDYVSDKITENDIQDSARIEQDSDQLVALYREKKLDDETTRKAMYRDGKINYYSLKASENPYCINMIICKNRHGKRGTLAFRWEGEYSRVTNFKK